MSVATNLRFGQRRTPADPQRSAAVQFDEVVELLGIGALLSRRPHTLSGGERQRVAIGRALLARPHLLLMDEPLASLDAARKAEILPYLTQLKTALCLPVIYVTHALDEVLRLADTVVLIKAGQVVGFGALPEMAARADLPMGQRDDAGALLICRVAEHDVRRGLTRLDSGGIDFWVARLDETVGAVCRIRVPAREVILAGQRPEAISVHNIIAGTVIRIADAGLSYSVLVEIGMPGGALLARVTVDAIERLSLVPGGKVLALIKSTSIEVLRG
jgi:molybdate transport system ATP-binding protein